MPAYKYRLLLFKAIFLSLAYVISPLKLAGQFPADRDVFFDSIKFYCADGSKTDKAVEWTIEFQKKWPYAFQTRIEKNLVQLLNTKSGHSNEAVFLEKLYSKNDSVINQVIRPIYFWNKIRLAETGKEANEFVTKVIQLIKDSCDYFHRTERYGLLALRDFKKKSFYDSTTAQVLLNKIIAAIENFPFLSDNKAVPGSMNFFQRHWFRCLYAYINYEKYRNNRSELKFLEKAVQFSPDRDDMAFREEDKFELNLFFENKEIPDYYELYFNELIKTKDKEKSLSFITALCLNQPRDKYFNMLQKHYSECKKKESFSSYWSGKVNERMKKCPDVNIEFLNKEKLSFAKASGKWICIDVWATWCSPCVKELPELQKFYEENCNPKKSKLKLYTLSYQSKDLANYIAKNKYTFPVAEISEEVKNKLEVKAFPTKFLINPQGKYLELPFGDWQEYIKHYTLVDLK